MARKEGAEAPRNFQSRENSTWVCAPPGFPTTAAAPTAASSPKSLILFMFEAPCEAGSTGAVTLAAAIVVPVRKDGRDSRRCSAGAARLGILLGFAYAQIPG